jgi:hypothetical protein
VSKLKYYVDKVKSFDLIGVDNGVFAISVMLLAFGLIVVVYLSAPVEKTTVEQTQIEKLQAQVSTIKGQILMIQQAGINPIEKGVK